MTPEQFYQHWEDFLENVRALLKRRVTARQSPPYNPLTSLIDDVINELNNNEVFIKHAISQTDATVLDFLGREIVFFNGLANESSNDEDDKNLSDAADTIKTSVEKIFHIHIPEKVKHVLDILNELLKLLS